MIESLLKSIRLSEKRAAVHGLCGAAAFPLFYFVWVYFDEQYENLPLRLLGSLFCLVYAARDYWPERLRPFFPAYWIFLASFSLPFFFTFMAFKNEFSTVWLLSLFSAIFVLLRLVRGSGAILIVLLGALPALALYRMEPDARPIFIGENGKYLFVTAYMLAFSVIYSYVDDLTRSERLAAAERINRFIAHEIKTILAGQGILASGVKIQVENLIRSYQNALRRGAKIPRLGRRKTEALLSSLDMLGNSSRDALTVTEILRYNTLYEEEKIDSGGFAFFSARRAVEEALLRYPYRSREEKSRIRLKGSGDFIARGADILFIHILFNLLKNSLRSIAQAGKGKIAIRLLPGLEYNRLIFTDTGQGLDQKYAEKIFKPGFSLQTEGQGMGLAFCRKVMQSFGGEIQCVSRPGAYARFILSFPPPPPDAVEKNSKQRAAGAEPTLSAPGSAADLSGNERKRTERTRHPQRKFRNSRSGA